jgi:hypothetical protein
MTFRNFFLITFVLYCRFHKQNVVTFGNVPQSMSNCLPTALWFLSPTAPSRPRRCCCCCKSGSRPWKHLLIFKVLKRILPSVSLSSYIPFHFPLYYVLCNFGGLLSCILELQSEISFTCCVKLLNLVSEFEEKHRLGVTESLYMHVKYIFNCN